MGCYIGLTGRWVGIVGTERQSKIPISWHKFTILVVDTMYYPIYNITVWGVGLWKRFCKKFSEISPALLASAARQLQYTPMACGTLGRHFTQLFSQPDLFWSPLIYMPYLLDVRVPVEGQVWRRRAEDPGGERDPGMNCIKIGLPGKLIFSKRKGLH